jgi:hypothetical protein
VLLALVSDALRRNFPRPTRNPHTIDAADRAGVISANPDRAVWGSNWRIRPRQDPRDIDPPHAATTARINQLPRWAADPAIRRRSGGQSGAALRLPGQLAQFYALFMLLVLLTLGAMWRSTTQDSVISPRHCVVLLHFVRDITTPSAHFEELGMAQFYLLVTPSCMGPGADSGCRLWRPAGHGERRAALHHSAR